MNKKRLAAIGIRRKGEERFTVKTGAMVDLAEGESESAIAMITCPDPDQPVIINFSTIINNTATR